jgi:hypothetical protein
MPQDPLFERLWDGSAALIGSCTNSLLTYQPSRRRRRTGGGVRPQSGGAADGDPGFGAGEPKDRAHRQIQSLRDIGAAVLANACGPCIGQ